MVAYAKPSSSWQALTGQKATTRPQKGIAQLVREATDGGRAIIEVLAGIALDDGAAARDRISASQVLLDRGFGRAVETTLTLSADASGSEALSALADAELERLAATLGPGPVVPVSPAGLPASRAVGAAAAALVASELLPEPPPEALDPLAPPLDSVAQGNGNATPAPVNPLPPPAPVRPRRRIVVPPPRVERPVAQNAGDGQAELAEGPGPEAPGGGGCNPPPPPRAGTEPL